MDSPKIEVAAALGGPRVVLVRDRLSFRHRMVCQDGAALEPSWRPLLTPPMRRVLRPPDVGPNWLVAAEFGPIWTEIGRFRLELLGQIDGLWYSTSGAQCKRHL